MEATVDDAVPSDWFATITDQIRQSEYHFSEVQSGWLSAPNRAQGLRLNVGDSGLRVTPRNQSGLTWDVSLRVAGYGREGDVSRVMPTPPTAMGDRVEFVRPGLTEWYVNSPSGIEQGFDLGHSPAARGSSSPLVIEIEVKSGLSVSLSQDSTTLMLSLPDGSDVLQYSGLHAEDSQGRTLDSHLDIVANRILLSISDQGASYPIRVDPLITSLTLRPVWSAESDQAGAEFGFSVAANGDINGDKILDVLVGAYLYDGGQPDEGRLFVYLGTSSGVPGPLFTVREVDQGGARFGYSVAFAGNVNAGNEGYENGAVHDDVIVGAPRYDYAYSDEGAAFVYLGCSVATFPYRDPLCSYNLHQSPDLRILGNQGDAEKGFSVSSAGDVNRDGRSDVIVGAPYYDSGPAVPDTGLVEVYLGCTCSSGVVPAPVWSFPTSQSDPLGRDTWLGYSVSSAGDLDGDGYGDIVMGAPNYHLCDIGCWNGAVYYAYGRTNGIRGTSIGNYAIFLDEGDDPRGELGISVASAGDVDRDGFDDIIAGADYWGTFPEAREGAAFLYRGSNSYLGLSGTPAWTMESNQGEARFGASVSSAGDVNRDGYSDVIIGAPFYTHGESSEGAAFVYLGSGSIPWLSASPAWVGEGNKQNAGLGMSVASTGDPVLVDGFYRDLNRDGYSDVIVGAFGYANPDSDEGAVFVYYGGFSWSGAKGSTVASAGDVNGDGYGDVIVGGCGYGELGMGSACVYLGSATGLSLVPAWSAADYGGFGSSVASAGDINRDGFGDVIIGAPSYGSGAEGRVFVYIGSSGGLYTTPKWTVGGTQGGINTERFGSSVASAGDVNKDGCGDVIVGAPYYSNGQSMEGRALVYLGCISGSLATTPKWTAEGNLAYAWFGFSVASAGDVNKDGFGDVIVGAPTCSQVQPGKGHAFVFLGSNGGPAKTAKWSAESSQANSCFGWSVASAGDVNKDTNPDVIVGAPYYSNGQSNEGGAFVYKGTGTSLSTTATWILEGNRVDAAFGTSVASAGDVDKDGYGDVIVGAPYIETRTGVLTGSASIYRGSNGGLATIPTWTASREAEHGGFGRSVASAGDVNRDGYGDVIVAHYQGSVLGYYGRG